MVKKIAAVTLSLAVVLATAVCCAATDHPEAAAQQEDTAALLADSPLATTGIDTSLCPSESAVRRPGGAS